MIGERLESRSTLSWWVLLLLAVGLGLVAAGLILGINRLVIGAGLPLALVGSLSLLGRERPINATFREDGLEIEHSGEPTLIRYASIQNIKVGGRPVRPAGFRKSSCPIAVLHKGGVLRIPSRLNFPSHEVYRFLAERVPESGGRDVNPVIAEYLDRQERHFGADRVATFRAASRRVTKTRRGYRAFFIGLTLAGVAWMAVGFSRFGEPAWQVAGLVCVLSGAVLFAVSLLEGTSAAPALKNWKKASLVIGPEGMAMVQGEIEGEVNWPELLEVRFNAKPTGFTVGHQSAIPGILLRVKGANIVIADIYDRPLYVIHDRIMAASGRSTPLDLGL